VAEGTPPAHPATLFRSVDVGGFAAALTDRLRLAGVEVGMSATGRFSQALACCPPTDTTTLYWVARTCLVHDKNDFAAFESVFAQVFSDAGFDRIGVRPRGGTATLKSTGTLLRRTSTAEPSEVMAGRTPTLHPEVVDDHPPPSTDESVLPELLPAAVAALADTPFDQLRPDDLDLLGTWLEQALATFPHRRSRRLRRSKSAGRIDLRATMLAARATGGEPIRIRRRRNRRTPRGIVVLADVSGSMESFARIYLHLMRTLAAHGDAEVFMFATSLRRVTVALRDGDPREAIDRLSDEVTDRFSGTRIAASLGELVTSPVWSNSVRGSVVLIASDGWDVDDPADLADRMRRLHRMAHRVIWVNPRVAAQGYEPLVGAMAAALPHIDELHSGHTLNAMRDVLDSLGDAS
jgi:uncharacterized protein